MWVLSMRRRATAPPVIQGVFRSLPGLDQMLQKLGAVGPRPRVLRERVTSWSTPRGEEITVVRRPLTPSP